jgi:hypothetical protein
MNKYLLLRDNKQSGPYTVPEIIAKGIKPYDLVWLEGKSAAWRYPSEIEELKAYAPAVEEQPFDRFYKKPEPIKENTETTATISTAAITPNSRFEPKVAAVAEAPVQSPAQKVYVNFPGSGQPKKATPVFPDRTINNYAEEKPFVKEEIVREDLRPSTYHTPVKRKDNKLLYIALAACFILIAFISVLLINYKNQSDNLQQLNTIVQQMENRDRQQEASLVVTPVTNAQPESPAPPAEETILPSEPASGETTTSTETPAVKKAPRRIVSSEKEAGVVFKENPSPDIATPEVETTEKVPAAAAPSENLFRLVSVKANKYKTGLLGGISNLQLELSNNSLHELHKVAVEIKYLGPEKKVVKRQTVYFDNVSPGSQAVLDVPKSNRGVTVEYAVTDIKN